MKKYCIRSFARLLVLAIIAMCAWWLPSPTRGWVTGFVGIILIDIYGILIEKGKL